MKLGDKCDLSRHPEWSLFMVHMLRTWREWGTQFWVSAKTAPSKTEADVSKVHLVLYCTMAVSSVMDRIRA